MPGVRPGSARVLITLSSLAAVTVLAASPAVRAQDPLPPRDSFLSEARENLVRSQREQNSYSYKERRTDVHTNPFGKIGTGGTRTFEMALREEPGVYFRRLIERDGETVDNEPAERIDRRGRARPSSSMDDVINTLDLVIDRRETIEGRPAIGVRFSPRPGAKPQTREGRTAKIFTGTIWIDEAAREVVRIDGTAIDDVSYGYGLVARLNEGTTVRVERRRIDGSVWLPVSVRIVGQGRAMLFRKLTVDFAIDWFDYRRVG